MMRFSSDIYLWCGVSDCCKLHALFHFLSVCLCFFFIFLLKLLPDEELFLFLLINSYLHVLCSFMVKFSFLFRLTNGDMLFNGTQSQMSFPFMKFLTFAFDWEMRKRGTKGKF